MEDGYLIEIMWTRANSRLSRNMNTAAVSMVVSCILLLSSSSGNQERENVTVDSGTTNISKSDLMLSFREICELIGCENSLWFERDKRVKNTSYICSDCTCLDDCYQKANCCPSKILEDIQYENSRLKKFPSLCSATELIRSKKKPRAYRTYGYWMVGTCPIWYPKNTIYNNCVDNISLSADISVHYPVTSFATNVTYKNIYCALCHGEDRSQVLRWKMSVKIDFKQLDDFPYIGQSDEEIFKGFAENNSDFHLVFEPPESVRDSVHACFIDHFSCKTADVLNNTPPYRTCQDRNYFSIFTNCNETNQSYFHCAICNTEYLYDSLWCPVKTQNTSDFPNHINVQFATKTDKNVEYRYSQKCAPGEVYDPKKRLCLDVVCGDGFVRVGPKCQLAIIDRVDEATYVLNALHCKHYNYSTNSLTSLLNSESDICQSSDNNQEIYILQNEWDICHPFQIWYRTSNAHRVITMLERRYHTQRESKNFLGNLSRIYILNHPNNTIIFNSPTFTNPIAALFLTHVEFARCSKSHILTFSVAKWQVCPKVSIESSKIYLRHNDFSFCFKDYDACVSHLYVSLSNMNAFEVCVDQYLQVIRNNYIGVSRNITSEYILIVCLIISLLANSFNIISILFLAKERTPVLLSKISLSATYFTLNFLHILIRLISVGEQACAIFGIFIHFLILFAVNWCIIVCVDLAFSIKMTLRLGVRGKVKLNRFAFYIILNFTICFPLIACNSLLNNDNNYFPGYSPFTCEISSTIMSLYTLGLPLSFCLIGGIACVVYISYKIKGIVNLENCPELGIVKSFSAIIFIAWLSWCFDILLDLYNTQIFASLKKLLTALIGIFIFFSFSPMFTEDDI